MAYEEFMMYKEIEPEVRQKYFEKYFEKIFQAAQIDFVEAMTEVAESYWEAQGVEQNIAESVKWFQKAVEAGDISAAFILGKIYRESDIEKSVYYLSKAADKNHIGAIERLAKVHEAQKDFDKMFEWYQRGAYLGNSECIRQVADCYIKGRGVQQDDLKALEWYIKAIELYYRGKSDKYNQDVNLLTKIYNRHFKFSDKRLVNYYYITTEKHGKLNAAFGIAAELYKTDKYRALKWYKMAEDMGDLDAALAVSRIAKELEIPNPANHYYDALEWYEKAAGVGDINAAKNLFLMYRDGHSGSGGGFFPNIEKSTYWLEKILELSKRDNIHE